MAAEEAAAALVDAVLATNYGYEGDYCIVIKVAAGPDGCPYTWDWYWKGLAGDRHDRAVAMRMVMFGPCEHCGMARAEHTTRSGKRVLFCPHCGREAG